MSDFAIDILHVGSTSIVGMSSKPIIDIDIVVESLDCLPEIKERLAGIGYSHIGNLGIEDREVFNIDHSTKYPHHLYVCPRDSLPLRNHMLLKKHLAENPEDFKLYNDLKINLANSSMSIEKYTKSKTLLILSFLEAEGLSSEEISRIKAQNLN
jgi:GrpB-like predicted nucleotidyltransferase (UPF0157 family)